MGRGDATGYYTVLVWGPGYRGTAHGHYKNHDAASRDAERINRALELAAAEDPDNAPPVRAEVVPMWKPTNHVVTRLWRYTWWGKQEQRKAEKTALRTGAALV